MIERVIVIVCDSLGVGSEPDAARYVGHRADGKRFDDVGANTFAHLSAAVPGFSLPCLASLGVGNITTITGVAPCAHPRAAWGRMREASVGKDTLTGHWEMMGLDVTTPFPSYPHGFPEDLLAALTRESGHTFIGNVVASGTEIIKTLGAEQLETGSIIIYTSTDSVLQLTANTSSVPLEELYRVCTIARRLTLSRPDWMVGRIIARPYVGTTPANFTRIPYRHDYAVSPSGPTVLDDLASHAIRTVSVGKIADIFNHRGLAEEHPIKSNHDGMLTLEALIKEKTGEPAFIFVNLVDFDALYGHRRDARGYANAVMEFDQDLTTTLSLLAPQDLLMITADHGNDPTWDGTDHTREYVPLLVTGEDVKPVELGTRATFADLGATVSEAFGLASPAHGVSFFKEIHRE